MPARLLQKAIYHIGDVAECSSINLLSSLFCYIFNFPAITAPTRKSVVMKNYIDICI